MEVERETDVKDPGYVDCSRDTHEECMHAPANICTHTHTQKPINPSHLRQPAFFPITYIYRSYVVGEQGQDIAE